MCGRKAIREWLRRARFVVGGIVWPAGPTSIISKTVCGIDGTELTLQLLTPHWEVNVAASPRNQYETFRLRIGNEAIWLPGVDVAGWPINDTSPSEFSSIVVALGRDTAGTLVDVSSAVAAEGSEDSAIDSPPLSLTTGEK
jgi:hypothetical protein